MDFLLHMEMKSINSKLSESVSPNLVIFKKPCQADGKLNGVGKKQNIGGPIKAQIMHWLI